MSKQLTIAIPTFGNLDQLQHTLYSLLYYTEYPYRILIINNDGTEAGKAAINGISERIGYDDIKVLNPGANMGWMGAINLALEETDTPLFCTLNDDVAFLPGRNEFWRELTKHFGDDKVGAVGPCSNFVSSKQNVFSFGTPNTCYTTLLIGFCMVIRTDALKMIGGLDESLPGGDDLDTSIRLRKSGYELVIERAAYLHHIGQQTGSRVQEGYWDSIEHWEATNNAIIKKHGIRAWYVTLNAQIYSGKTAESRYNAEGDWVSSWVDSYKDGVVLNAGSGASNLGIGMDKAKPGESGAGGRKFNEADPDMVGDVQEVPLVDKSVDLVVASHLFEHITDPVELLGEWRRTLKDDGKMIIVCPDESKMPTMVLDHTHKHAYTADSMKRLLEVSGWDCVETRPFVEAFGCVAVKGKEVEPSIHPYEVPS